MGAGVMLVGRSRYCDYPAEVSRIPVVGGYVDPSFEAILALDPDLVMGARGPAGAAITERLESRGIRTFFPQTETISAIEAMISGLAKLLNRTAQADQLIVEVNQTLAKIDHVLQAYPRPRTLLVFGLTPTVAAGTGSFADEMLTRAGGSNVIQVGPRYPTLGVEDVIAADPDVVIDAAVAEGHGKERIGAERPGWSALRAVQQGRVATVDDNAVLRPGPRVAAGVGTLARLLHPGVDLR